MLIKITEKCSMGCKHCLNDARPAGEHMTMNTFRKAVQFQNMYGPSECMISGGEPSEHPEFLEFLEYAVGNMRNAVVIVATNGTWIRGNEQYIMDSWKKHGSRLMFQISMDERYYPYNVDVSESVLSMPNVCTNRVYRIYPQGRALINNIPSEASGVKCFNIRAIPRQLEVEEKNLKNILQIMYDHKLICTPHIDIYGNIKLGESDLCPVCSNISKTDREIIQDIMRYKCNGCLHVVNNMSREHRLLIGQ